MNGSEAAGDLVLIQTSLLFLCKCRLVNNTIFMIKTVRSVSIQGHWQPRCKMAYSRIYLPVKVNPDPPPPTPRYVGLWWGFSTFLAAILVPIWWGISLLCHPSPRNVGLLEGIRWKKTKWRRISHKGFWESNMAVTVFTKNSG